LKILNDYANKDSRIKVIDKPNGGCGSARNRGLEEASGEYIYFFDPDDILEKNTFELAYDSASRNDSEMVVFKANVFDKEGISNRQIFFYYNKTIKKDKFDSLSRDDLKEYVLKGGYAPWSKLYKKEFLDRYDDFKFDLGIAFDDVPFHVKSMTRARKISFVNRFLYHYRVDNVNSVNSTASNGFDIFKIIDYVEDILKGEDYFKELEKEFYLFQVIHILLYIISTDSEEYFEMARERFKKIDRKYLDIKYVSDRFDMVLKHTDYEEFKAEYNLYMLNHEIAKLNRKCNKLESQNKKLKKENSKLSRENKKIMSSRSWKITEPLRRIRN
jgi:glycosyltransferase involved in cell wall biosynthesis